MKEGFPTTLDELQKELHKHSKDGRSDPGFRLNIALAQMGNVASHFTHDQKENPFARPYGTRMTEISDIGHAIVQLCTYADSREIKLQEAVNLALINLREKDFMKREAKYSGDDLIIGQTGMTGKIRGKAFVDPYMLEIPKNIPTGLILVTLCPPSDARLKKFAAIVTDHGSFGCHAAIIARECGIPCVVNTGNATERIKTGFVIEVNASVEQGQVWKI